MLAYILTRFHELHCVASLRIALQNARKGEHVAFNQEEDPHWPHCLHYLHQVSMPLSRPLFCSEGLKMTPSFADDIVPCRWPD